MSNKIDGTDADTGTVDRRTALKGIGTAALGGISLSSLDPEIITGISPETTEHAAIDWGGDSNANETFLLSVVSGGPTPSGAILWTKLSEANCSPSAPVHVQVATDESFSKIVYEGKVAAEKIKPD